MENTGMTRPDRRKQPIFYVYVYWFQGVPFYVGKGWGKRAREHFRHQKDSTLMQRKMAKLIREGHRGEIEVTFFIKGVDEETAFFWEGFLIRALGRRCDRDGPLCNLTWGGDRTNTGYRHDDARKKKISEANHRKWRDPEKRKRILDGMKTRKSHAFISKHIARLIARNKKRIDESIRRLQHGSIRWVRKRWSVSVGRKFVGYFVTYPEAEFHRVEACRMLLLDQYDEWIVSLRERQKESRAQRREEKFGPVRRLKEAEARRRSARWQTIQTVKLIREYVEAVEKRQRRDEQLRKKPWLVDSPYCVFMLICNSEIEYVGFGRPEHIHRLLHNRLSAKQSRIVGWLDSLDEVPEVITLFVQTREQAIVWRRAWNTAYQPHQNKVMV